MADTTLDPFSNHPFTISTDPDPVVDTKHPGPTPGDTKHIDTIPTSDSKHDLTTLSSSEKDNLLNLQKEQYDEKINLYFEHQHKEQDDLISIFQEDISRYKDRVFQDKVIDVFAGMPIHNADFEQFDDNYSGGPGVFHDDDFNNVKSLLIKENPLLVPIKFFA